MPKLDAEERALVLYQIAREHRLLAANLAETLLATADQLEAQAASLLADTVAPR